jgi:hypothetical protein
MPKPVNKFTTRFVRGVHLYWNPSTRESLQSAVDEFTSRLCSSVAASLAFRSRRALSSSFRIATSFLSYAYAVTTH